MMRPVIRHRLPSGLPLSLLAGSLLVSLGAASAQQVSAQLSPQLSGPGDVDETLRALAQARAQGEAARQRGERLEAEAARTTEAADQTARQAAAIAARIQQSEAGIATREAQIRLIDQQRIALSTRLAERQRPLVQVTAALQRLSRRPPVLSLLRPGSVRDTMYVRAVLDTMMPQIERSTAALRAELNRGRRLQQQARQAAADLRASEAELSGRRQNLAAIETRQRLASRDADSVADREAERALALAEQARDLGSLVDDLGKAGALRDQLALLPGPVLRPRRPDEAQVAETALPQMMAEAGKTGAAALGAYALPVDGKLTAGFGDVVPGSPKSRGITLACRAGAQAVAPAAGRVAFAGPYRGFGTIVIIEHPGSWTTLVTGLAQLDTRIGASLLAGSPLGSAGPGHPAITVELRHDGIPVNPLDLARIGGGSAGLAGTHTGGTR